MPNSFYYVGQAYCINGVKYDAGGNEESDDSDFPVESTPLRSLSEANNDDEEPGFPDAMAEEFARADERDNFND